MQKKISAMKKESPYSSIGQSTRRVIERSWDRIPVRVTNFSSQKKKLILKTKNKNMKSYNITE